MKPSLVKPTDYIWVLVPLGLWLAYSLYGLPHLRFSYSWRDDGQGYDPFAKRYYTRCTYIGPYGEDTILPLRGHCPIFRLIKKPGHS